MDEFVVDLGLEIGKNRDHEEHRMRVFGSIHLFIFLKERIIHPLSILIWSYLFGVETLYFSPYETSIL